MHFLQSGTAPPSQKGRTAGGGQQRVPLMATRSTPRTGTNKRENKRTSSTFQQNVFLVDWWLIKAKEDIDGKRLAVGGLTHEGQKGARIFCSAPIVKKYDMWTLQAADGVTVFIMGSINETRSQKHGITSEVCKYFWLGFPYNWEDSGYHCREGSISTSISCLSNDQSNLKDGGSREKAFKETLEDASSNDIVLQKNAEFPGSSDLDLHKTKEITAKNKAGATKVVSSTSYGKCDNQKESRSPIKARKSSRPTNMKKGIDSKQECERDTAIHVTSESDLVTGDGTDCNSGIKEDIAAKNKAGAPDIVSVALEDASSNDIVLQENAEFPGSSDLELHKTKEITAKNKAGAPEVVSSTSGTKGDIEAKNKAGAPEIVSSALYGKLDSQKESRGLFEVRKSSRLKSLNKGTENKQYIEKDKAIHVTLGSDLRTGDAMGFKSGTKVVVCSPSTGPHEKLSCFSDGNRRGFKEKSILTLANTTKVSVNFGDDTMQDDASKDHLQNLGVDMNNGNPSEVSVAITTGTPKNYLENSSKRDTVENSDGEHMTRCSSRAVASHGKMNSRKRACPFQERRSSRLKVIKYGTNNAQETERTKTVQVSVDPVFSNARDEVTPESGGKILGDSSSIGLDKSMLKSSVEISSHDNKGGQPKSKTKRRLEYNTDVSSTPIAKNKKDNVPFLSPEESSSRKSRSGRSILPPLDYWRHQRAIYDMERRLTGVWIGGMSVVESPTGSKSEPLRKRRKFL